MNASIFAICIFVDSVDTIEGKLIDWNYETGNFGNP